MEATEPLESIMVPRQKRKRKALSCYECRRQKLKCDRELPCARCCKSGHANTCSYDAKIESSDDIQLSESRAPITTIDRRDASAYTPPATSADDPSIQRQQEEIAHLKARMKSLEDRLASFQREWPIDVKPNVTEAEPRPRQTETIMFRGKTFKTQFYGATNPTSILAHFPELRSFMIEAGSKHRSLHRARCDLKAVETRYQSNKKSIPQGDLTSLLPDRGTADRLIYLYIDTIETIYRIIHIPTFLAEYQSFWQSGTTDDGFIALLLLIMTTVSCISERSANYVGGSSLGRDSAVTWIEASESWLQRQSQKHLTITNFQVRCLLIVAKQMNGIKVKQAWLSARSLLTFGMATGLHRDPSLLGGKISPFNQEMRRRVWATMRELELSASIERGMPANPIQGDCYPPRNIDDSALGETIQTIPQEKSQNQQTQTSFLSISGSSLKLRTSLTAVLNEDARRLTFEEVLHYEEKIMKCRNELPQHGDSANPSCAQVLLDLQLRQFLLMIHAPIARRTDSSSQSRYSKAACLDVALNIMNQHSRLVAAGNYTLLLLRPDVFRVGVCLLNTVFPVQPNLGDYLFQSMRSTSLQIIEKALEMIEERVMRLGRGFYQHWFLSAARGLLRSLDSSSSSFHEEAINCTTRLYYQSLALQDVRTKPDSGPSKDQAQRPLLQDPAGGATTVSGSAQLASQDMDFFDYELSEWTLDDLWMFEQSNLGI